MPRTAITPSGPLRIYVASLAAYNAGKLHGVWIDLDGAEEDAVYAQIKAMMAECPEGGEEYVVLDSRGFGRTLDGDGWLTVEETLKQAAAIEEHGNAWIAYVESVGVHYATPEHFAESYVGEWDSFRDFAIYLADSMGYAGAAASMLEGDYSHETVDGTTHVFVRPNPLMRYIDWDAWARDWETYYSHETVDGTTYVFYRPLHNEEGTT